MADEQTRSKNLKILSVVWFKVLPPLYGRQKATAIFNNHLGKHSHLKCLCSKNNEPVSVSYDVINTLPVHKLQFLNPLCWVKIIKAARSNNFTILEFPYYGIAGFLIKKLLKIPFIVRCHNIEYLRFKQHGKWWWKLLYYFEKWTLRQSGLNIFITDIDAERAISDFQLQKEKCFVIPYGVERPATVNKGASKALICKKHGLDESCKIILFAGTLDYFPNASAVEYIFYKVLPIISLKAPFEFKIIICGRNRLEQFQYLNSFKNENFIYAGEVQNIEEYFTAADVFIDPVFEVAGIQTKILDALNFNLNVVAFEKTIEGININVCADKIIVVDQNDEELFADKIIEASNIQSTTPDAFFRFYNTEKYIPEFIERLQKL